MSLSGPQRQAEERLARPVHCPDPREPRPPLHAWAPRCTCLSVKLSGPEPRAVRAGADWRPVSEGAESKPVKATGSWDQLGQQLGAAGTELRAGHRGPGDRRATPVGRAQSWSTRRWPVQGRPPTSCPCGQGAAGGPQPPGSGTSRGGLATRLATTWLLSGHALGGRTQDSQRL